MKSYAILARPRSTATRLPAPLALQRSLGHPVSGDQAAQPLRCQAPAPRPAPWKEPLKSWNSYDFLGFLECSRFLQSFLQ